MKLVWNILVLLAFSSQTLAQQFIRSPLGVLVTLVLDMYDSAQQPQRLVWHGKATKTFDQHNDEEAVHKTTERAIEQLMKKFPPEK